MNWVHHGAQKKKCRVCGLKKSYKDATLPISVANASTQRESVKSRLDEVASHLQQVTCARPLQASTWVPAAAHTTTDGIDRKAISEEIDALENSLATMPLGDVFLEVRESVGNKIQERKKLLVKSKPIGAQVDACRELVSRCLARKEQARVAVELAQHTHALAEAETTAAQKELATLESELAQAEHRDIPVQDQPSSLEGLPCSMTRVLAEMWGGGAVPDSVVTEAEIHMTKLMTGIQSIVEAVQTSKAAAVPTASAPNVQAAGADSKSGTAHGLSPGKEESGARRTKTDGKKHPSDTIHGLPTDGAVPAGSAGAGEPPE
jgi:hypothetical protein